MDHTDRDLDLAVELINTYWVLASPPDALTDIGVYQRILSDAGEHALAGDLLLRAGEPERALEEYLLAASAEARQGRYLAAGYGGLVVILRLAEP